MRTIKFRGKRVDNGEWVYGDLVHTTRALNGKKTNHVLIAVDMDTQEVHPETVGQFTGLHDKDGNEIYEGDILKLVGGTCDYLPYGIYPNQSYKIGDKMIAQSLPSGFTLCGLNMFYCQIPNRVGKVDNYAFWNHQSSLLVISNIHDNPELIK